MHQNNLEIMSAINLFNKKYKSCNDKVKFYLLYHCKSLYYKDKYYDCPHYEERNGRPFCTLSMQYFTNKNYRFC